MSKLLPEQAESAASSETLAIYAELRRLCGVPMVPLIYRHLATIPGALTWAWSLLGPAMRSGRLQESAWTMTRSIQLAPAVRLPAEALQSLGVTPTDLAEFHKLLEAYNRSNPVNLVGLRCLALFALREPEVQPEPGLAVNENPDWQPPDPVRDLLPMISPDAIQGDARALMHLLNDRGDASRRSPIWPSLYRHFAARPPLLALSAVVVPPAFQAIDTAADAIRRDASQRAEALVAAINNAGDAPSPSGDHRRAIISAIDLFTERLPELIAIGSLLKRSFPNPALHPSP